MYSRTIQENEPAAYQTRGRYLKERFVQPYRIKKSVIDDGSSGKNPTNQPKLKDLEGFYDLKNKFDDPLRCDQYYVPVMNIDFSLNTNVFIGNSQVAVRNENLAEEDRVYRESHMANLTRSNLQDSRISPTRWAGQNQRDLSAIDHAAFYADSPSPRLLAAYDVATNSTASPYSRKQQENSPRQKSSMTNWKSERQAKPKSHKRAKKVSKSSRKAERTFDDTQEEYQERSVESLDESKPSTIMEVSESIETDSPEGRKYRNGRGRALGKLEELKERQAERREKWYEGMKNEGDQSEAIESIFNQKQQSQGSEEERQGGHQRTISDHHRKELAKAFKGIDTLISQIKKEVDV